MKVFDELGLIHKRSSLLRMAFLLIQVLLQLCLLLFQTRHLALQLSVLTDHLAPSIPYITLRIRIADFRIADGAIMMFLNSGPYEYIFQVFQLLQQLAILHHHCLIISLHQISLIPQLRILISYSPHFILKFLQHRGWRGSQTPNPRHRPSGSLHTSRLGWGWRRRPSMDICTHYRIARRMLDGR